MTMQSDIKQFPQAQDAVLATYLDPSLTGTWIPWGVYSGTTLVAPPPQRCRIRGLVIQFGTGNDGDDYGNDFAFGNGTATEVKDQLFRTYIPSKPYTGWGTDTITYPFPGEGILVQDTLWVYVNHGVNNYNSIFVLYS